MPTASQTRTAHGINPAVPSGATVGMAQNTVELMNPPPPLPPVGLAKQTPIARSMLAVQIGAIVDMEKNFVAETSQMGLAIPTQTALWVPVAQIGAFVGLTSITATPRLVTAATPNWTAQERTGAVAQKGSVGWDQTFASGQLLQRRRLRVHLVNVPLTQTAQPMLHAAPNGDSVDLDQTIVARPHQSMPQQAGLEAHAQKMLIALAMPLAVPRGDSVDLESSIVTRNCSLILNKKCFSHCASLCLVYLNYIIMPILNFETKLQHMVNILEIYNAALVQMHHCMTQYQ